MDIKINLPDYNANVGIQYQWVNGFEIEVALGENEVIINANEAGLKSLANHLLSLANDKVPKGSHLHFDEHSSLEDGSLELVIQKK